MVSESGGRRSGRGEYGGGVTGVRRVAGGGWLQVRVGGAMEVRRGRSGTWGGGGGSASCCRSRLPVSRRKRKTCVGGASVLPGEAAVNQQREFRNRRLNSTTL